MGHAAGGNRADGKAQQQKGAQRHTDKLQPADKIRVCRNELQIKSRDSKKKKPPDKNPPQPTQEQHEANRRAHQRVPPARPGIAAAAITRLVPKRNVLIRKDPDQDYYREIGESDNQYLHRRGI